VESLQPTFVGLRSAVSMALVIVIVAEMFIGSDNGLGHRIIDAQQVLNVKSMYAAILSAACWGTRSTCCSCSPSGGSSTGAGGDDPHARCARCPRRGATRPRGGPSGSWTTPRSLRSLPPEGSNSPSGRPFGLVDDPHARCPYGAHRPCAPSTRRSCPTSRAAVRAGPAGTEITIRGLTKYFAGWPLYENFDLNIPKHRIVSVFGPNGCGKSTLINMIAGLIPIDAGEILFDGKSLAETKIGYVFQNYREAMFPWMRTIDNIAYPLKLEGKSKAEVDRRVAELVASFDVKFDLNRYPYELSGGQQQTASIMRALAPDPEVLFLDEPFSALDFEMTLFIREKLQQVFMATGTTMMLVSHDLEEAVYLADEALLLTKRPTRIAEILRYEDPRPRTVETLSTPSFIDTKRRSLEIFQREVRR